MALTIDGRPVSVQTKVRLLDLLAEHNVTLDGLRVTVNGTPVALADLATREVSPSDDVQVTTHVHLAGAESIHQLIGTTPLVRLRRVAADCQATIWAKLEGDNPGRSVKDRPALAMIEAAEREGIIAPGRSILVEATSGNTGISLAMIAAAKGYRLIVTMPENMTRERVELLRLYGAEVVLTPAGEGMAGAVRRAEELAEELSDAYLTRQFDNPANPEIHYTTTGPEIWRATGGQVDAFVAGVGTGGTITGAGRYLKQQRPDVLVVAVEPASSPVLSGGKPGRHGIPGIGAGFIPSILDQTVIDEIVCVADDDARTMARRLAAEEGISAGISAGAAACAAIEIAKRLGPGKTVVAIFPDDALKYISLFAASET